MTFRRALTALAALFIASSVAVRPVDVKGSEFVNTVTNKRLMIIGVDYQPGGQGGYNPDLKKDPLSDAKICLRDAAVFQRLGINTIRVYNVDPDLNHDDCASIFNAAGIYIIVDVNSPFGGESIDRSNPKRGYHKGYLTRIFKVVENFKNYPNTLAFFAANEVMNDIDTAQANPPYIRAVQRDLKNYIAKHASRPIPVGYSAADVREILEDTWAYLQCAINGDQNDASRADFFGLNSYSWCGGDATFESSGYKDLVDLFKGSTIPVFFSEYGCNEVKPRVFDEVQALYGKQMTSLSGGLVYEYSEEESHYGLVTLNDNNTVHIMGDYDALQGQYAKLDIKLIESADSAATSAQAPKCDASLIKEEKFSKNFKIPALPPGGQDLIDNGVPDATVGKLVEVKETNSPYAVFGSDGKQIDPLTIKILGDDESNIPSANQKKKNGSSTSPTGINSIIFAIGFMFLLAL